MKDGEIVLEVLYPRARVARYMPDGKGGMVVEYADPQPPVVVLLRRCGRLASGRATQVSIRPRGSSRRGLSGRSRGGRRPSCTPEGFGHARVMPRRR
jgi:hypothetical protein